MYGRGHTHGTRRQSRQASSWYDAIAEATLRHLETTWPLDATLDAPRVADTLHSDDSDTNDTARTFSRARQ